MIITETKKRYRPNTEVEFFNRATNQPIMQQWYVDTQPYIDSGDFTETITVSEDGLTQTTVHTYNVLDIYSAIDSSISIALNN
jgi:hypothetical protein